MSGLLHRLRLSHKFLILGLLALCMVALPTLLFLGESLSAMRGAERAAAGMPPLAAVQQAITRLQVHRGLSSGMLNGDTALAERRPAVRDALHQALDTARERLEAADAPAASRSQLEQARQTWQALEQAVAARSIAAPDSLARHTALVEALMRLNESLRNDYGLTISPRPDQQALADAGLVQAPLLAEHLGRLRAQGAGALAQQQLAPEARGSLRALLRRVDELNAAMARASERALAAAPGLQGTLAPALQQARERVLAATQLATSEVTDKDSLSLAPARYFDVLTQAIETVNQFADTGLAALTTSLQAGVQHQQQRLTWLTALQIALLAGAVALARVFVRSITQPLDQAVSLARAVAMGELDGAPIAHGHNEMGQLLAAQQQMRTQLRTVVSQVREGSDSVATASAQIAQGNHDLSARTENQAAALEETAASMEQLSATVRHNADSAHAASQLATRARDVAQQGGAMMGQVVQTMQGIDQASQKMADIIGVINGIAFQTNILALNAAVEAARAGEQGRGFAVVASEVRTLAQRSAAAAKEIKDLIDTSASRVQEGNQLVAQAGQTMDGVLQTIGKLHTLVAGISSASQEQASGVAQVGEAVTQMDQATQQNAALVEQMAAAATHLRGQAQDLVAAVAVFQGSGASYGTGQSLRNQELLTHTG